MSAMRLAAMAIGGVVMTGCASKPTPPPIAGQPIGLQMLRVEPQFKEQRFNTLLDFESERDAVFITAEPSAGAARVVEQGHTGTRSLALPAGTRRLSVKLPLLLAGRVFPGEWTLMGAYFRSPGAGQVEIAYETDGQKSASRSVTLRPNVWNEVLLDVSAMNDPNRPAAGNIGMLMFTFDGPIEAGLCLDDVLLIDNTRSLVGDSGGGSGAWSIWRKGFSIRGDQPGRFSFTLATPQASPDGWTVDEANELRARFGSAGSVKRLTVYSDGRAYWDGTFKPMSGRDASHQVYQSQHDAPAELMVPETLGRVNRNTAGDANNDGYNEARGAYQLIASGPRLEVRITPRTPALARPVLEISGMPDGKALVTIEGQLVDHSLRLPDGTLLIEIPVKIQRSATVNVRVN